MKTALTLCLLAFIVYIAWPAKSVFPELDARCKAHNLKYHIWCLPADCYGELWYGPNSYTQYHDHTLIITASNPGEVAHELAKVALPLPANPEPFRNYNSLDGPQ